MTRLEARTARVGDRAEIRAAAAHPRAFLREARFALRLGILSGASGPPGRGLSWRGQTWLDDGVRCRASDGGVAADGHRAGRPPLIRLSALAGHSPRGLSGERDRP